MNRLNASLKLLEEFIKKDSMFQLKLSMVITTSTLQSVLQGLLDASFSNLHCYQDTRNMTLNSTICTYSSGNENFV